MKALVAVLCLVFASAAGAVGGVLVAGSPSTNASGPVSLASGTTAAEFDSSKLVARIESLNQEVTELHLELMRLKQDKNRVPATAAAEPVKVAEADTTSFAAEHREAILKIIAQDREDQDRKREEERKARDLENILNRADRTAKKLGLNATQQKSLADVYILERQKMDEMRNMRGQGDPEAARTAFREFRDWRTGELTKRFGPELTQQLEESDIAGFRGGGFGGGRGNGPGGGGGPGGPGGGPPGGQ
jgi:hypothetical protein